MKRIMRYLRGTVNLGLAFTPQLSGEVSDADWGGDVNDRKSTSGYLFQVCGAAISWRSKKQTCIALSTAEVEYMALASATQEAIWLGQLTSELGIGTPAKATTFFEDNQSAIGMTKNPQFHGRSKHIAIKYHFVRDQVGKGTVKLKYCPMKGLSVIGGLDYWNGLLEWTTGMDFDLFFLFLFSPRANYVYTLRNLFSLTPTPRWLSL